MKDVEVTTVRPLNKLLRMAVTTGVESALRVHIERGDDLNARDQDGFTPLMLAAARNRSGICKLLLTAGADAGLLDRFGRTALNIATSVGAHETVALLAPERCIVESSQHREPELPHSSENIVEMAASQVAPLGSDAAYASWNTGAMSITIAAANPESGASSRADEFDLSGWEAESEAAPPPADTSLSLAASAMQTSITEHEPLDSSSDWDDIDAYLPDQSSPLLRPDDTEARKQLRLLLLRAIREGSVPRLAVEDLSHNVDGSFNPEAAALLCMVINDLGAEADERFEYTSSSECFEVRVAHEATSDEESTVEEALAFVDGLISRRAEPLRFYQREFQRTKLLTADEEISLAQSMDRALEAAIYALASWPHGLETTLAAGRQIESGKRSLHSVSLGPVDVADEPGTDLVQEDGHIIVQPESDTDRPEVNSPLSQDIEATTDDFSSAFSHALNQLAALTVPTTQHKPTEQDVRDTLKILRLNRRFLLELAGGSKENGSKPPVNYAEAIAEYRCAWERMVVANLKLSHHLAMKYRYSGEPPDDLIQEANIGLFKAIERFDWRRGFRFSTYATWWIRQQISRYVADKCRSIRLPVHVYEKVQRICRVAERLEAETGLPPHPEEIAAWTDMPVRMIVSLLRHAGDILSLEDLRIDDEIAVEARSDFISQDPVEVASQNELFSTVDGLLRTLKPKEERVIRMRFGIGVNDMLTLEEVGIRFDVTRERIRQIEATALRKLRHPSRRDALAAYGNSSPLADDEQKEPEQSQAAEQEGVAEVKSKPPTSIGALASGPKPRLTRSANLEKVLTQAAELGIPVEDDRFGPTGRIWVKFNVTQDQGHRRLARKLMALGFEFRQGMGYWK